MPKNGIFQRMNEIFQKIVKAIRIKRFNIIALAENMFMGNTASYAVTLIISVIERQLYIASFRNSYKI